ncbi:hypothetical protein JCM8547_007677, partial [Rhodosporidiobolus lusitaniae]
MHDLQALATAPLRWTEARGWSQQLPSTCSISALRDEFEPFPVRLASSQRLSFVILGVETSTHSVRGQALRELVVRPMKRADVERVKRLQ